MNKFFSRIDKILMAVLWAIPGVLIGVIVRLFSYSTDLSSIESIAIQYLPWGVGFGIIFSAFGYFFPNLSAIILEMLLGIEFGK